MLERKSTVESEQKEREAREKEKYWREAEGPKSRAEKKHEEEAEKKHKEEAEKKHKEEAEKRAKALAEKAETCSRAKLEEKVEKVMPKPNKKANRVSMPVPKVTLAELQRRKEEEPAELVKKADEAKRRLSRMLAEEE